MYYMICLYDANTMQLIKEIRKTKNRTAAMVQCNFLQSQIGDADECGKLYVVEPRLYTA